MGFSEHRVWTRWIPSNQKSDVFMNSSPTLEACSLDKFASYFVILSIISTSSIESIYCHFRNTGEISLEFCIAICASRKQIRPDHGARGSLEYRWPATSCTLGKEGQILKLRNPSLAVLFRTLCLHFISIWKFFCIFDCEHFIHSFRKYSLGT